MADDEIAARRRALDEQLRAGIETLQAAHRVQVQALEVLRIGAPGGALPVPSTGSPPPLPAEPVSAPASVTVGRRQPGELREKVLAIFEALPQEFTKNDVVRLLELIPDRSSLFRTLDDLVAEGFFQVRSLGVGRSPTIYRKKPAAAQ